jgi:histidyl-tRNA synthetase
VLILGQDELARNEVQIKEMATGRQENVRIGDLEERIKAGIRNFTIDRIPEKTQ